jgi:hypothetical protein
MGTPFSSTGAATPRARPAAGYFVRFSRIVGSARDVPALQGW